MKQEGGGYMDQRNKTCLGLSPRLAPYWLWLWTCNWLSESFGKKWGEPWDLVDTIGLLCGLNEVILRAWHMECSGNILSGSVAARRIQKVGQGGTTRRSQNVKKQLHLYFPVRDAFRNLPFTFKTQTQTSPWATDLALPLLASSSQKPIFCFVGMFT